MTEKAREETFPRINGVVSCHYASHYAIKDLLAVRNGSPSLAVTTFY